MQKLLIASFNQGKVKEIKSLLQLQEIAFNLISFTDLKNVSSIEESGKSFKDNAILKAKYYAEKHDLLTLAEDSGLEVDELNGRPGIKSARYATGEDTDRVKKLLQEMKEVIWDKRTARFVAAAVIYHPQKGLLFSATGICNGFITSKPVGQNGFGYDPVFYLPEFKKTSAQLTLLEKNKISHRAKALIQCRNFLTKHYPL